jgi:hypothetical protein
MAVFVFVGELLLQDALALENRKISLEEGICIQSSQGLVILHWIGHPQLV